jgi:3D (Asp-Asp-Asp) domain-containing protein
MKHIKPPYNEVGVKNKVIGFIIAGVVVILMFIAFNSAIQRQEKVECLQWQKQAKEYPDYFAPNWAVEQCDSHNIPIWQENATSEATVSHREYQDTVMGTIFAYNSEPEQTNGDPFIMASGNRVYDGAIANNCLKFGTQIEIEGKIYTVEDRLASRYDCTYYDIWMENYDDARRWGVRNLEIKILK